MFEKYFTGQRTAEGVIVLLREGGNRRPLPSRPEIIPSLPDAFAWGDTSPAAGRLALALCLQILPAIYAEQLYGELRDAVVAKLCGDSWTLTASDLLDFLSSPIKNEVA